jgi:DNA-directed RNA polymerase specialized sigma24 family protein
MFVKETGPGLRRALIAAYGPEVGAEATAEALAYGWEHWRAVQRKRNPGGFLYRVGQSRARRYFRRRPRELPPAPTNPGPVYEPGLSAALADLTDRQRAVVTLVHGFGYTLREVGELLGISRSTVQRHLDRAVARLRRRLEVRVDA